MKKVKTENNSLMSNEEQSTTLSAKIAGKMFCNHSGMILNNLGIFACIVGLLLFFSFIIPVFYFCLLFICTIATVGVIFLIIPNFAEWWALLPKLSEKIGSTIPASLWLFAISFAVSSISLVLLLANKQNRNTVRIVTCIITIVVSVVAFIICYFNLIGV